MPKFFKLTEDVAKLLLDSDLTANDYRLFIFLSSLNPFSSRCELSYDKICTELHVSISTARRSLKKLTSLGLITLHSSVQFSVITEDTEKPTLNVDKPPSNFDYASDEGFVTWLTNKWSHDYGKTQTETRINVLRHCNSPKASLTYQLYLEYKKNRAVNVDKSQNISYNESISKEENFVSLSEVLAKVRSKMNDRS